METTLFELTGARNWDEFREFARKVNFEYVTGTIITREDILRLQELVRKHG